MLVHRLIALVGGSVPLAAAGLAGGWPVTTTDLAEPADLLSAAPRSGVGTFALTPRVVAPAPAAGRPQHATVTLHRVAGP